MIKLNKIEENNKLDETHLENEDAKEMAKKRILNPKTGKYMAIRQRTTEYGRKGQIKGRWKQPKKRDKSESIFYILGFGIAGGIVCSFIFGPIGIILGFVIGGSLGAIYRY